MQTDVLPMAREEAAKLVEEIQRSYMDCRQKVYQLYTRKGWLALGYSTWEECLEREFRHSRRHLWRELKAAQVEVNLCPIGHTLPAESQIGTLPESHAREIAKLLTPAEQRELVEQVQAEAAKSGRKPTAKDYREALPKEDDDEPDEPTDTEPPYQEWLAALKGLADAMRGHGEQKAAKLLTPAIERLEKLAG